MKFKVYFISFTIILFLFSYTNALAQGGPNNGRPNLGTDPGLSGFLTQYNNEIGLKVDLRSINGIISTLLPTAIILGGIILLYMLISGGFTMMTSISDPKGADAGKQRITIALTGFFLLFASYWIIQLLEMILGVTILG